MTLAVEPIVKISIEWGASTVVYSDKTDTGEKGTILNFDVVTLQGRIGSAGSIGSVNVTLDDTDGTLKTLYDTDQIEGRKCTVTQVFTGGLTKSRTILVGRICADINWSEGERALTFSIESIFADNQIGYAPKDGDYAWLHPDAIGIPWPICFGSVLRVPAVRVLKPWDLKLGEDVRYNDPSPFTIVGGEYLPQHPTSLNISIGEILFTGTIVEDQFTPTIWNRPKYTNVTLVARPTSDPDYGNGSVFWIANPNISLIRHYCLVNYDGSHYTVNRVIHQEGAKCWCEKPWDFDLRLDDSYLIDEVARYPRISWDETFTITANNDDNVLLTIAKDGWKLLKDAIVYYQPVAGITDRYICNLVTSEEVVEVFAHRQFFGKRIFCAVPSSYYTLNLDEDLDGRHVTSITMDQPLSSRYCEGWEDDLYVSLVSSISPPDGGFPGGNTSEIIRWILETYTDLDIDDDTFNDVYTYLYYYPSNFAIFDQPNAVEVCQEIAWQARCALVVVNGIAYLQYLPKIGSASPVETLTNALTELKTVNLGLTPTEDVITKITAKWVREYSGEKIGVDGENPEHTLEKEYNVATYGLHELDKNFFIYNIEENVIASVEFWLKRLSNVWKTIKCNAFVDIEDVNVFDYVLFNITNLNFPAGGAKGELIYIGHNTGEPIIELQATLAIKAGTIVHSADFWYVPAGSYEDVLEGLAVYDYIIASDYSCPDWVQILPSPKPKYHFVFVIVPKRILRNVPFVLFAEIQDEDGNLITEIDPAFASLEIHSADRWDNPAPGAIDMIFVGGKWDNVGNPIIILGGSKHSISHLWIKSKDSRIFSSRERIGAQ